MDHIGSTAVPGLDAKDVIDLQLIVADLATADRIAPLLAAGRVPALARCLADNPKPSHPDPADWAKRLHGNADPGRAGEPPCPARRVARLAVCPVLPGLAARRRRQPGPTIWPRSGGWPRLHSVDKSTAGYAADKEAWFTEYAAPRMEAVGAAHRLAPAAVCGRPPRNCRAPDRLPVPPKAEWGPCRCPAVD